MHRRNLWKYDETMEMLIIMKKHNYPSRFCNKHNQNMHIFRLIETELRERGYSTKNAEQICVRWKNLKNLYQKVKRSNDKNEQALFPYYIEMNELTTQTGSDECTAGDAPPSDVPSADDGNVSGAPPPKGVPAAVPGDRRKQKTNSAPAAGLKMVRKRRLSLAPRSMQRSMRPVSTRLESTLASSRQELSDEFYRTQKRLIDYEFNLYMKKEQELIGQLQATTRRMLDDYMGSFFTNLKQTLGLHGNLEYISYDDDGSEDQAEGVV